MIVNRINNQIPFLVLKSHLSDTEIFLFDTKAGIDTYDYFKHEVVLHHSATTKKTIMRKVGIIIETCEVNKGNSAKKSNRLLEIISTI